MHPVESEHLFSYSASLAPPEIIGPVLEGIRANFYVMGGTVSGPKLQGKLKAVGADRFCLRRDGVGVLDVSILIETDDGALIDVSYSGLGDLGMQGYDHFLEGKLPNVLPLRTTPVLRTAHPSYQWLHRRVCVGIGAIDMTTLVVNYDVYALR